MKKQKTPSIDMDSLIDLTHTRKKMGTQINIVCKILERQGWPFKFTYKKSNIDELKRYLDKDIPSIVVYDGKYIKYEISGPAHAGVVIGITDNDDFVLSNPWYGPEFLADGIIFERAWELKFNRAIIIKPIPQTELEVEIT